MKFFAGLIVGVVLVALLVLYLMSRREHVIPPFVPAKRQAHQAVKRIPRSPFVIEGEIRERRLIKYVLPRYPEKAEELGLSGIYKGRVTVSPSGDVKSFVEMLQTSGNQDMDAAALDALRTWRFSEVSPMTGDQNGTIAFHFQMTDETKTPGPTQRREDSTPSSPLKTIPAAKLIDERKQIMRYEDLGPATIDVKRYPDSQKVNYELFLQRCSRCHTPARAINSSATSEQDWNYYVRLMHTWSMQMLLKPSEGERIVNFLAYDSKIRKIDRREDFLTEQKKLKEQFAIWAAGGQSSPSTSQP